MKIKGYNLINPEKVDRALYGTQVMRDGEPTQKGGIVKEDGSYDDGALLAEYDRLGGAIFNAESSKVQLGSFYDFKAKKPFVEPKVILVFRINGEVIEVPEGEPKPDIVRAAQELEKQKKTIGKKKDKKIEEEE